MMTQQRHNGRLPSSDGHHQHVSNTNNHVYGGRGPSLPAPPPPPQYQQKQPLGLGSVPIPGINKDVAQVKSQQHCQNPLKQTCRKHL